MKTLKIQLLENLINNGIKAIYEKSDDCFSDDSIYYNNIDIQLGKNYVIVWKQKDNKSYLIWENNLSKKNINIVSDYIVNLIKNR